MKILVAFIICIGVAQCADLSTVRYLLWTRSNPGDDDYFELQPMDANSLAESPFNGTKRTHFVFHGFADFGLTTFIVTGKTNLLEIEDINYIGVDWGILADRLIYLEAKANMIEVANYTAQFIDYLVAETELTTSNMHVWGHSLGGHASGLTGHMVTSGVIDRISALDPSGPDFYNVPPEERVDITSGAFVDVIHTHGGSDIADLKTGLLKPIGHVDFYPNGGASQPGCDGLEGTPGTPAAAGGCSHTRSHDFYVESITSNQIFNAYPCDSWDSFVSGNCDSCGDNCTVMGYHTIPEKPGIYYLHTNAQPPYAIEDEI